MDEGKNGAYSASLAWFAQRCVSFKNFILSCPTRHRDVSILFLQTALTTQQRYTFTAMASNKFLSCFEAPYIDKEGRRVFVCKFAAGGVRIPPLANGSEHPSAIGKARYARRHVEKWHGEVFKIINGSDKSTEHLKNVVDQEVERFVVFTILYVCVLHVSAHTHTHTRAQTHTHTQTHLLTHSHTHTHTFAHSHSHTYTHSHTHTHTHSHTHTHTLILTLTLTHSHTHVHTHTHVDILVDMPHTRIYLYVSG